MTKPRISKPEHLAEADRILNLTVEQRAEIAREEDQRALAELGNPAVEEVRRTGVKSPGV